MHEEAPGTLQRLEPYSEMALRNWNKDGLFFVNLLSFFATEDTITHAYNKALCEQS